MKHPILRLTPPLLSALLLLSSCGAQNTQATPSAAVETAAQTAESTAAAIDTQALFSDRDLAGTYDESAAIPIQLNGDSASRAPSRTGRSLSTPARATKSNLSSTAWM